MAQTSNRIQNQGLWIGAGLSSMDDTALYLKGQLGMVIIKPGGKAYQLVQFKSSSTTLAAGTPVLWTDPANFVVSAKIADGKRNQPAGAALLASTAGNYGFIQVAGPSDNALLTAGTGAANGDTLVMNSTDGTCLQVAAGTAPTYIVLANATAAESAATVAATIVAPHNGW